jgi:hypothetical protein
LSSARSRDQRLDLVTQKSVPTSLCILASP